LQSGKLRLQLRTNTCLSGKVINTGKPVWSKDHQHTVILSAKKRIAPAFAVPVIAEKETAGVLEFFSSDGFYPDKQLQKVICDIGVQLGRVIERQRSVSAILDIEMKFRAVAESANEAVISADNKGNIIYINKSTERIFGYKKHELMGKPIYIIMPERYRKRYSEALSEFLKKGTGRLHGKNTELGGRRKDGSEFPLELSLAAWETSSGYYFTGMIRDITRRKLAEEKLMKSEKQLRDAQHLAKLGSFEWDIPGSTVALSEELYNIYGITAGKFGVTFESFLKFVHPEEREFVHQNMLTASSLGKPFDIEYRIVRNDKEIRILQTRGEFISNDEGQIIKLLGVSRDVTELKQAEEELKVTYEKLKETQNELIHSEKLAALGRFSSGIAHEIRNPLANISALAQIVLSRSNMDRNVKKHLRYILENTEIANKIIQDLLNFASPEEIKFQPGDAGLILKRLCSIVKPRCENHKVKLRVQIASSLPKISLNEKKLRAALMNFISNSIEAMPHGGKLYIRASKNTPSRQVVISFEDTGIGISQEYMDKIFEPFFTTKDTGTGLGLSLAYQVIKSHSGNMEIQSKINEGTKIIVRLPYRN
jgi:PAS domain S-box-containing protein